MYTLLKRLEFLENSGNWSCFNIWTFYAILLTGYIIGNSDDIKTGLGVAGFDFQNHQILMTRDCRSNWIEQQAAPADFPKLESWNPILTSYIHVANSVAFVHVWQVRLNQGSGKKTGRARFASTRGLNEIINAATIAIK